MPAFVVNARYVLLTYAQSDGLDPFRIVEHLSSMGAECIVAREAHADGGTHLHAFVDFGRKFRSRRHDIYDVDGFHPNISPSLGNPEKGYDYACKDGEIVAGGLERPQPSAKPDARDIYAEICMAPTREEFFEAARTLAPRLLLSSFTSLSAYADWNYRVDPEPYRPNPEHVSDLSGFPQLSEWAGTYIDWDASVSGESYSRCISHPTVRVQSVYGPPLRGGDLHAYH